MKKLFMALMAVLVLVSCGVDKKEVPVVETEADVLTLTAKIMNDAADGIEKATTAKEFLEAMEAMAVEVKKADKAVSGAVKALDKMSDAELNEKYPEQMEVLRAASEKYYKAIEAKNEIVFNLTPQQKEELVKIFQKIQK
jgi:hypothetical protein